MANSKSNHATHYYFEWSSRRCKNKLTRQQQIVVDVMSVVIGVLGDGFIDWWEGFVRFEKPEQDFPRIVESFRLAGLDGFADIVMQTAFCRKLVEAGLARAIAEGFPRLAKFRFSRVQKQTLWGFERQFKDKESEISTALQKFLPPDPA